MLGCCTLIFPMVNFKSITADYSNSAMEGTKMGELIFRKLAGNFLLEDIEKVALLAREIWYDTYSGYLSSERESGQIDYMLGKFQSPIAIKNQIEEEGFQYYLLVVEDQEVGYLALQPQEDSVFLSKLYLQTIWQGKNLSSKIFKFIHDKTKKMEKNRIWLTVNRNNTRAIAAYEKYGFVKTGDQIKDIGAGCVMDDHIMSKQVNY